MAVYQSEVTSAHRMCPHNIIMTEQQHDKVLVNEQYLGLCLHQCIETANTDEPANTQQSGSCSGAYRVAMQGMSAPWY